LNGVAGSAKTAVREAIESGAPDWASLLEKFPERKVIKELLLRLPSTDPDEKRMAVEGMGQAVSRMHGHDPEAARVMMQRLMWSLNEESGGCAFGAPEAMAEIMARTPELALDWAHVLISFITPEGLYLDYGPLQKGAVWGIARLAEVNPELLKDAVPRLEDLASSADPEMEKPARKALQRIKK